MSIAMPLPETEIVETPVHTTRVGGTLFHCIQPNCDGVHHFYCSCREH